MSISEKSNWQSLLMPNSNGRVDSSVCNQCRAGNNIRQRVWSQYRTTRMYTYIHLSHIHRCSTQHTARSDASRGSLILSLAPRSSPPWGRLAGQGAHAAAGRPRFRSAPSRDRPRVAPERHANHRSAMFGPHELATERNCGKLLVVLFSPASPLHRAYIHQRASAHTYIHAHRAIQEWTVLCCVLLLYLNHYTFTISALVAWLTGSYFMRNNAHENSQSSV